MVIAHPCGGFFYDCAGEGHEWFGTLATQRESPGVLRLGGLLFIFAVFFIALMFVEALSKI